MAAGASGALASPYVEFITKGLDQLQDGLDVVKGNLDLVDEAGKSLGDNINAAFGSMTAKLTTTKAEVIALEAALASGKYDQFAKEMVKNTAALEKLQAQAKLVDLTKELEYKDPTTVSEMQKLNSELAIMQKKAANMDLKIGVNLGVLQEAQQEMAKLNAETRELERPLKVGAQLEGMAVAVDEAKVKLEALKQAVASGDYAKYANEMAQIAAEMKKVEAAGNASVDALKKQQGGIGSWAQFYKDKIAGVVQTIVGTLQGALQRATQSIQSNLVSPIAIGAAVAGLQMVTAAAHSWVSAGLSGTSQGNALSMQFTLLSHQIAGVFVPTINLVIHSIERLTAWFRSLDGNQQAMIRRWVEAAAVMVVVSQIAGRIAPIFISMIGTIIGGVVTATATITSTIIPAIITIASAASTAAAVVAAKMALATAGISLVLGVIATVVTGLLSLGVAGTAMGAGIVVGTSTGRSALASLFQAFGPVIAAIRQIVSTVGSILGPALEEIAAATTGMFRGIDAGPLRAMVGQLVDVLRGAMPIIVAIAIGVINVVSWIIKAGMAVASFANQFGGAKIALGALAAALAIALVPVVVILTSIATLLAAMAVLLTPIVVVFGAIATAAGIVVYVVTRIVKAVWPLFDAIGRVVVAIYEVVAAIVGPLVSAFGQLAGLMSPLELIGAIFDSFLNSLTVIASFLGSVLIGTISLAIQAMAGFADMLGRILERIPGMGAIGRGLRDMARELRAIDLRMNQPASPRPPAQGANGRTDVSAVGGNFEQAQDLFRRIQEASIKTDAQRQISLLGQIAANTTPQGQPTVFQQVQLAGASTVASAGANVGMAVGGMGGGAGN